MTTRKRRKTSNFNNVEAVNKDFEKEKVIKIILINKMNLD